MSLEKINMLGYNEAYKTFAGCCGSDSWVKKMITGRPFKSKNEMIEASENTWNSLTEKDWLEAFEHHPMIGDLNSLKEKYTSARILAENEQAGVNEASTFTISELSKFNTEYLKKFGYIFIVCATGKSADEMLSMIKERIKNDPETEIKIAMKEQGKITKLRLEKIL